MLIELSAFSSSIFNKFSQSTEKWSKMKFCRSNLSQSLSYILDLLPEMLSNLLRNTENWGRWSEIMAVKLPDIMSGSITFENILFIRALKWIVILVVCKIKCINELKVRKSKNSFDWLCWL